MLNRGGSDALPRARALSRAAALACGGLHGWPPLRRRFLPALSRPSRRVGVLGFSRCDALVSPPLPAPARPRSRLARARLRACGRAGRAVWLRCAPAARHGLGGLRRPRRSRCSPWTRVRSSDRSDRRSRCSPWTRVRSSVAPLRFAAHCVGNSKSGSACLFSARPRYVCSRSARSPFSPPRPPPGVLPPLFLRRSQAIGPSGN